MILYKLIKGDNNICKSCYGKINTIAWKTNEYDDNETVEKNRAKTLKIANKNNFPTIVIDGINKHYDGKIQKGLLYVIDGGIGQKLKVFTDHCVLITDSDEFDTDDITTKYNKMSSNSNFDDILSSGNIAKSLAKSVLTGGGLFKAGIGLAAATASAANKSKSPKNTFKVKFGNFRINYITYTYVERKKASDSGIGFIKFVSTENRNDDILFFYNYNSSKLDNAYKSICESIDTVAQSVAQKEMEQQSASQPITSTQTSIADEILKFKQLLDMGAITQEEFDAKKKELLNL